jgi:hypothetical protein
MEMHAKVDHVLNFFEKEADRLKSHAEDLRNHARSVHDQAQASKNSVSREIPTR